MELKIKSCHSFKDFQNYIKDLEDSPQQLIQIVSSKSKKINEKIIKEFNLLFPLSEIVGVTAEEGIINGKVVENQIIITAIKFENSSFKLLRRNSNSKINAEVIADNIQDNTKAVIVFSDNKYNDGDQFVNVFNQYIDNIILAGGFVGFSSEDKKSYLFDKNGIIEKGLIAVILNGDNLKLDWKYSMGWESLGREMEITKIEDKIIYELDGRSIFKVYSELLGEDIKSSFSPNIIKKFPLILNDSFEKARSVLKIVDQGFEFSSGFKKGDKVRIGYGSLNRVLSGAVNLIDELNFSPEIALVYSCSGRSNYFRSLNSNLSKELQIIPCQNSGFSTFGEYGTVNFEAVFLNITSTVLYLSEKSGTDEMINEKIEAACIKPEVKTEYLLNLSKKVVSELEMINDKMRKANKKVGDKKIAETAEIVFKLLFENKKYSGGIIIKEAENLTNIYLDENLGKSAYDVFRSIWSMNIKEIKIKNNILGYKKAFIIPITKELEALIIVLSNEIDLYDIKKNILFIEQIPNYLKKAVLYESLERNLASLSTLEQTSDFLYSTLDLDLLYERILDIIVGTMGMSAAIIFEKEGSELKAVKKINVVENSALFCYLKEHYQNLNLSEKVLIENKIFGIESIETLIAIPINLNDYQCVLYAVQFKYKQLINENQKKFMRTLANQIRVSIRNALNHNKVKKLSVTDGLTNLYNHSYFHDQLKKKRGEKYSIAIMDIDDFKDFNDLYGHQAGDEILKSLSQLLKNEVRENDIVARYGGEEFVIYFKVVKKEILFRIIKRLLNKIRLMEVDFNNEKLKITVSIGVAINKEGKYSSEELIKYADNALYKAKEDNKDIFKFYSGE